MKRTLFAGALVVVLVAALFTLTGCGDKKANQTNENVNTNESANTNTNANENANQPVEATNTEVQATEFYIQNAFPNDTTLKEIYATVSNMETWTPNLIAGLELAPSTRAKIGLGLTAATTTWDIKLVDSEGTAVTCQAVDLTKIMNNEASAVELTVDENGQLAAIVK